MSTGYNRYRNNPALVGANAVSYHAEEMAIMRAGDPRGATIYVARITKGGLIAMSKPCQKCQELLLENGVCTVVFTETDGVQKFRARYELEV